jgi:hypothetical protein
MIRLPVRFALPVLLLFVAPAWAHFSSLSGDAFTYCYFLAENTADQDCLDSEFVSGGGCSATCDVPGSSGAVTGFIPWQLEGYTNVQDGDAFGGTEVEVAAERLSSDVLTVSGFCWSTLGWPEYAVFRFAGDPSVFDGTAALSVLEFVDMGLIAEQDVLLVQNCPSPGPFSYEIDVSGIPDNELILFAGSDEQIGAPFPPWPVPATSPTGTAALTLLLLILGAIALRKSS